MATDSVTIAIEEAKRYLDEVGSAALFTHEELEQIIRASFTSLRSTESKRDVLQSGILALINKAANRVQRGEGSDAI